MGVLFNQERRQWAPEPIVPPFPGWSSGSSSSVRTKEEALAVSTVWYCVGKIANSVSLMALETFTHTDDTPQRVPDPQIVTTPSAGLTQSDFLHQVTVSLLLRGNAYGHIVARDRTLRATQIELLDPDQIALRLLDDGSLEYRYNGDVIPTADVWHVRGMTLPGSKVGVSPIAYGAAQMGVELSAVKFAKDFFDGGGIPKAVLTSEMEINQETAKTLKERLVAATRNREPIALGSGVKYQAISLRPDEAQFIATQQNATTVVAKFFFMSPEDAGGATGGSSVTYANREQRAIDYATYTVGHWLKRIEDAYFPLLPGAQFVQFNERNLLRTDAETQAKVDAIRIASKVLPPSRVLRAMNEPPLTEDEKKELELVPMTVTAQGAPRALTSVPTPQTAPDTPDVNTPSEG